MVAAGEIEGLPVVAAKGEVGGGRRPVNDAAQLSAVWIHDPKPTRSTAMVVSFQVRGGMNRGTAFLFEIHGTTATSS